jgi:polyisoprenoid-binding protein YceI
MNILIKLSCLVGLTLAPLLGGHTSGSEAEAEKGVKTEENAPVAKADLSAAVGEYVIDGSHSPVNYSVSHLLTTNEGSLVIDSGYIKIDSNLASSKVFISLDMNTLSSGNSMRDSHLKEKESNFDVAKFPKATFTASEIKKCENCEEGCNYAYIAKGDITLKGVTKPAEIKFNYLGSMEIESEEGKISVYGFKGQTKINRMDFKIGGDGGMVGKEVTLNFSIDAYPNQ